MRALSLWQPWAFAVTHLGKRIENRTAWKSCNVRGPFLIHAAKADGGREAYDAAVDAIRGATSLSDVAFQAMLNAPRGAIVGAAVLDSVIDGELAMGAYELSRRLFPLRYPPEEQDQRKWWLGGFALVLKDVIQLQPRPWKGKQGWFDVPEAEPILRDGRLAGVTWRAS